MRFRWLRPILRNRALSAAVVGTVAAGVASLTATFGVVNAALYREPPFADARRIVLLYLVRNPEGEAPRRERWSFPRLQMLHQTQHSFERSANYSAATFSIAGDAEPEVIRGEMVSASYFPTLRVAPSHGRVFSNAEDAVSGPAPVALASRSLWARRWPTDSSIIGRSIRINGVQVQIIGVVPDAFRGITGVSELWLPATMAPQLTYPDYVRTNQNFISLVARLKPNVSLTDANAELGVLGTTINRALPSNPAYPDERVTAVARALNDVRVDATVRRSLTVLLVAVVLLHLLACANVINLLLGRAAARRRESAVRVAIGSSSARLFQHLFTESAALVAVGAILGVFGAWWLSSVVVPPTNIWAPRNFYGSVAPFDTPSFGSTEAAFGIALAVCTTLLVAVPPALTAVGIDVAAGLKAGARGMSVRAFSLRRPSARGVIVGLEAALAMLLVVAAGLLIDSYQRMRQKDLGLGVDPNRVLTFWVIPSEAKVPPAVAPAFVARLLEAIRRVPGVVSASVDGGAPLSGTASALLYIDGRPAPAPGQAPPVLRHYVAPEHFRTLGIRVIRGREFRATDIQGSPRVTIISEGAARKFWPDEDPIGRRVWFSGGSSFNSRDSSAEIIGIVSDVVYAPLDQRPNFSSFYTPFAQFTYASRAVFVRTDADPIALVPDIRRALVSIEPDLTMRDPQRLSAVVNGSWARQRFDAVLFGGFGIAAMLLAASGIFAVLAYAVATRAREFGIRIALGASSPSVIGLVLREGLAFPAIGIAVGVATALGATRMLRASLYEVSPLEPRVYAGTVALLLAAAVAACIVPAMRATRADPMEALRAD